MKNALVTLADENYVLAAQQLFSSIFYNHAWNGDCIILAHNLSQKSRQWFIDHGVIVFECKPLFSGTPGNMSATLTSKFYLFTSYFKKYDRVIYLDADSMVCGNLDGLLDVNVFGSVEDISPNLRAQMIDEHVIKTNFANNSKMMALVEKTTSKFDLTRKAFCAGFFVFSPSDIPKNTGQELISLFKKYEPISKYGEQLAFNLYFYHNWERLPPVYNQFVLDESNKYNISPKRLRAIIFHFAGKIKPWEKYNYYSDKWQYYFSRADNIDMKRVKLRRTWTSLEIKSYSKYLEKRKLSQQIVQFSLMSHMLLGRVGTYIKSKDESVYDFLCACKQIPFGTWSYDRFIGFIGLFIKIWSYKLHAYLRSKLIESA